MEKTINGTTQDEACSLFWKEHNKNLYGYGQYGGKSADTFYIYKRGGHVNAKAIKTFKFTKENIRQVQDEIYKFLDKIGSTEIFKTHEFLNSFRDKIQEVQKPQIKEIPKVENLQLSLF